MCVRPVVPWDAWSGAWGRRLPQTPSSGIPALVLQVEELARQDKEQLYGAETDEEEMIHKLRVEIQARAGLLACACCRSSVLHLTRTPHDCAAQADKIGIETAPVETGELK